MKTGVWWRGHSESHCCSSAEGLEPGDRLGPQAADETGSNRVYMSATIILSATSFFFFLYVLCTLRGELAIVTLS